MILNKLWWGVVILGWGYVIYITGGTLQFYCTHYFHFCQVFYEINLKRLQKLDKL
jgi:fatty acid desaturase